jgi:hypothetical protein
MVLPYTYATYIRAVCTNEQIGDCVSLTPDRKRKGRERITYAGVPTEIMALIDQVIESGKYGYLSRNQFLTESAKMRLRDLGYYK